MTEPHSNQATPKYLGYVYQVLIAIEQCFQAKSNETIWIECFGDVYDGHKCTEVKHHFERTNLTSNSVDFWKTLKNFVIEDTDSFNSLILHTTENIPENSIFYGWDELSKTVKYKRLKDHSPSEGIKDYYKASMIDCQRKNLLPILERLSIKSSQLCIKDKWGELKNTRYFSQIPDNFKIDAFHWVYGYINWRAINHRYSWHIKINDFDINSRHGLSTYRQDKIPFEIIDKDDVDSNVRDFRFVEKMKEIKLREKPIENAVSNYLRSKQNQIKLLKYEPFTMSKILDKYDASIFEIIESLKNEYSENIEIEEMETEIALKNSRDMYHCSMRLQLINIPEVNNTPQYYQNGRIHHNVNEGNFIWKFCEDDLL